jgi:capsule polysaccharide export protein KpsC/LpsZ
MLIVYPFYIHPKSKLPTPPETLIEYFIANGNSPKKQKFNFSYSSFIALNRLAIKMRDR